MRELEDFERSLLLDAFERPIAVGGALDETLEMLCNSYELLEQQWLPGYVLGAWVITEKGRDVIKNHKGRFVKSAANAEWNALCDRCGVQPDARIALAEALLRAKDDPERTYEIAPEWQSVIETVVESQKCSDCGGHGADPMSDNVNWMPCRKCQGTGKVRSGN